MKGGILFVVALALFVARDVPVTSTNAAEVGVTTKKPEIAIISNPGTGFRGNVFSCYVCHPNLPSCGNRVDCCTELKEEHLQACPAMPHFVCFKTQTYDGTFYNVTRGCGKKYMNGPSGQSDTECQTAPNDPTHIVCNCIDSQCNSGRRNTFSAIIFSSLTLIYLLKRQI